MAGAAWLCTLTPICVPARLARTSCCAWRGALVTGRHGGKLLGACAWRRRATVLPSWRLYAAEAVALTERVDVDIRGWAVKCLAR
jgi:hypothetical protein